MGFPPGSQEYVSVHPEASAKALCDLLADGAPAVQDI
jgi:hypothetical protein